MIYLSIDDSDLANEYAQGMLDYAFQRAKEVLSIPDTVVMVTNGPAGIQVGEFLCEAIDIRLFLLVPQTSDHLFNLEHESGVTLLSSGWEMKGDARIVTTEPFTLTLNLLQDPTARWCQLVQVEPGILQIHHHKGWGSMETIDFNQAA